MVRHSTATARNNVPSALLMFVMECHNERDFILMHLCKIWIMVPTCLHDSDRHFILMLAYLLRYCFRHVTDTNLEKQRVHAAFSLVEGSIID